MGHFIKRIFTENTGGGCMVDFIELPDGRVIGLNDECIVLYPTMQSFYVGDSDGNFDFPTLFLNKLIEATGEPTLGCFINAREDRDSETLLVLTTGEAIRIDSQQVCLYPDPMSACENNLDSEQQMLAL